MLLQKYNSIMEKSEEHRNKWALGLSVTFSILIFTSFTFYKGYLSFGSHNDVITRQNPGNQIAAVVSAETAASPIENTKKTFEAAFGEISKQYQSFTDSLSAVFVPFITGIEVYKRK
jgi:hypothetical protein